MYKLVSTNLYVKRDIYCARSNKNTIICIVSKCELVFLFINFLLDPMYMFTINVQISAFIARDKAIGLTSNMFMKYYKLALYVIKSVIKLKNYFIIRSNSGVFELLININKKMINSHKPMNDYILLIFL